ncbi:MAG TPA: PilZ domain-containing protein [Microvirga sp.]|jgi:hypothetical protein|nr:PilZ domain-containing protein [Microvirga sp.]
MDDRRASPRRRTFLGALLKRPSGAPLGDCIVRDLSKTGARLYVAQPIALPGDVELEITKTGERFRAEVVWATRDSFGLRFSPEKQDSDPRRDDGMDRSVQDILEAARTEIAALVGVRPSSISLKLEVPETTA